MDGNYGLRFYRDKTPMEVEIMEKVVEPNGHTYERPIARMTKNQFLDWIMVAGVLGMTDYR